MTEDRKHLFGKSTRNGTKAISLNCNINETLTTASCTKIVMEIAKYIIYHKLIPYPYSTLKAVAKDIHFWTSEGSSRLQKLKSVRVRRHYRKMVDAYENFEDIFQNIHRELQNCVGSDNMVEEVALLMGATTRSPQEMYRIMLPAVSENPQENKEIENRLLLRLLQSVVVSEEFNDMLDQRLSPTNMYVVIRKRQDTESEWFLPMDSYRLPSCRRQATIYLTEQPLTELMKDLEIVPARTLWFQSKVSLKGFKHFQTSGASAPGIDCHV